MVERLGKGIKRYFKDNLGILCALAVMILFLYVYPVTHETFLTQRNIFNAVSYTHLDVYKRQGVDGMLIDPSHGYLENVKMLEQARVPFVILEHPPVAASMNSATCDHMGGAYLAATYMASRGCRKILFLNLEHFPWRRDSFEQGLVDSGLSVAENMVFHRLTSVQGETYDILTEELARHPDIDSIFAFNDAVAYDAICSLKKLGKGVPKDIRVVGNLSLIHI